jgi:general secretion pathway protein A
MNPVQHQDYYHILGIPRNATKADIERAFRTLTGRWTIKEPEQTSFLDNSKERLSLAEDAYSVLSNNEKRDAYDQSAFGFKATMISNHPYAGPKSPVSRMSGMSRGNKSRHSVYEDYFGFSEKPFDLTPDPKYLYLSPKHKEVLAHLVFGLQENNGFLKIVGEVGTGKTTISRSFLSQLDSGFNIAYIFNPCLNSLELIQTINSELGIPSDTESRKELIDILNAFLLEERKKGKRVVLIVDEAQDLETPVLEQLRLLSNLETNTQKLIQIILIGQPELDKILQKEELRQLKQRITIQWELLPLNQEETRGYIQHRLNVALGKGKVRFTKSAMDLIFRYSQGIPRMINVLADRSLLIGFTLNTKKITAKTIKVAAKDVGGLLLKLTNFEKITKTIFPAAVLTGLFIFAASRAEIPQFAASMKENIVSKDFSQYIRENPLNTAVNIIPRDIRPVLNLSETTEKKVPRKVNAEKKPDLLVPKTTSLAPKPVISEIGSSKFLEISQTEKLVTYLSSLTLEESKEEATKWVLETWGVDPGNLIGMDEPIFENLEVDFGLSFYEFSGNFSRLATLNYPVILEMNLPNAQGTKYLALVSAKNNFGTFGSVDKIEMPFSAIESLWNNKAIVFWKDFEALPVNFKKGFRGKESIWLQKNLRLLGFFKGREASNYGPKTIDAVKRFQRKHGIKDEGSFDTESRLALYNLLNIYNTPKLVVR